MRHLRPDTRAAILDDLRDGLRYDDIMERHSVSRSLVSRLAVDNGLRRNRRVARRCAECKAPVYAGDLCRGCNAQTARLESPEALSGGRWVLDPARRIQVWREMERAS